MDEHNIEYTSNMTKKELLKKIDKQEKSKNKRDKKRESKKKSTSKSTMKTRRMKNKPSDFVEKTNDKTKFGQALALLRVALGIMFVGAGWSKIRSLLGEGGTADFFASLGVPFAEAAAWSVGVIELLAGLALVLGVLMTLSTAVLSLIMIVAMFLTAIIGGFDINGVIEHLIYVGALLTIMFDDVKAYAIDNVLA